MNFTYKKAVMEDLERLTETRMEVLRAVFNVSEDLNLAEIRQTSLEYYQESLEADRHAAYLVFAKETEGEVFAGTGGISFYQVMPTCDNPTGKKAYVMNMYTRPEYRGQGVAGHVLELLIKAAHEKGISHITLDASDMGRKVYVKHGFVTMKDEMKLQ